MKSKPDLSSLKIEDPARSAMDAVIQGYVQAINDFHANETDKLSDELEQFLLHVAKTGDTLTSWEKVQKVFVQKMKLVLNDFYEANPYKSGKVHSNCENDPFDEMKERLVRLADEFESTPFTFQRLCELITNPRKNYTKCEKFMRAVEKNLMVVSSWTYPTRRSAESTDQVNGGFDSRTNYNYVERPWSTLPHSPVATSAPTIPEVAKAAEDNASKEAEKPDIEAKDAADAMERGDASLPAKTEENKEVEASVAETSQPDSGDAKIDKTELPAEPKSETVDTSSLESSKNEDGDEKASKEPVAMDDTKTIGESNPTENVAAAVNTLKADSSEGVISNAEKDEKKEPLPSVGTLVEKHSVIKCSTEVCEPTTKSDNPASVTTEKPTLDPCSDVAMTTTVRSPKRKLSEEETPMEVGSPTKRSKQDEDAKMSSPDKE